MAYPLQKLILVFLCLGMLHNAAASESYSFGVLSQRSAVLTAQYWNPVLDYVHGKTGIRLDLKVARSAPESNLEIDKGSYDFVYSNTIFQPSRTEIGYRVILKPREEKISGQIVTLTDSPIRSLKDLSGKEVGFPSITAFVGYAVPMDKLLREGIKVTPVFGGNQEGIMAQLKSGRVIAAGVNNQVMKTFAARESVRYRVLWESEPFLNLPIAAHPRVPKNIVDAVRKTLDNMDRDPDGAKILEQVADLIKQKPPYGFRSSSPLDYRSYTEFYKNTLIKDYQ